MWDFSISAASCCSSQKTNNLLFGDRGLLQKEYVRTSVRPDINWDPPLGRIQVPAGQRCALQSRGAQRLC